MGDAAFAIPALYRVLEEKSFQYTGDRERGAITNLIPVARVFREIGLRDCYRGTSPSASSPAKRAIPHMRSRSSAKDEDVPNVVEKERFSLGACRGGKLPKIDGFTKGEPQWQERIGRRPRVPAVTAWT